MNARWLSFAGGQSKIKLYSRPTCLVGFPEWCQHSAVASLTPWRAGSWRSCSVSTSANVTTKLAGFRVKAPKCGGLLKNKQHRVTSAITLYYTLNTKTHRLQGVSSRQGYTQFHGSSTKVSPYAATLKGRFTHSVPRPCRSPAIPFIYLLHLGFHPVAVVGRLY